LATIVNSEQLFVQSIKVQGHILIFEKRSVFAGTFTL